VLPLHHPIRIVEDWSVIDNLSGGRVGISLAPGFHPTDFVLAPQAYERRRETLWREVDTLRRAWRGDELTMQDGVHDETTVRLFPQPIQPELPLWITAANKTETFSRAGEIGANVLTGLLSLTVDQLRENISQYRSQLASHHPHMTGKVTVMLHTFIGTEMEEVRKQVKEPFCNYLRTHMEFIRPFATQANLDVSSLSSEDTEALLEFAFERYFETNALLGTPESCAATVEKLTQAGVDEVACLIDFGVEIDRVMESLGKINELRLNTKGLAMSKPIHGS
jgi:natural product biosynthesis luciferase-like monooxygenase protein